MAKKEFAQTIINKVRSAIGSDPSGFDEDVAIKAMTAFSSAVVEYLNANTEVVGDYYGTFPSGGTDAFQRAKFTPTIVCSVTPSDEFDSWYTILLQSITPSTANSAEPTLQAVVKPFKFVSNNISVADLTAAYNEAYKLEGDVNLASMERLCQGIIDWCSQSFDKETSFPATRTGSTGFVTLVSVEVK